jgi:Kef-type K+ transport system membrane component KefB
VIPLTCAIALPITGAIPQFALLVTAVLLAQLTLERVHLPPIVGLVMLGALLGPGATGVLEREPIVSFLGDVGLVFLLFLAGLEIDLETARARRRETVSFGVLAFGCSMGPAVAAGLLMGYSVASALLLGTLIASHTLLAFPVLEKLGLIRHEAIVTAIGGTLVTDTLALVTLAFVIQLASPGGDGSLAAALVPLALLALQAAGSLYFVPRAAERVFASPRLGSAKKATFALFVILASSELARAAGTESILGAFIAGLSLNRALRRREDLREHVEFVGRTVFVPYFFLATGMLFDFGVVSRDPSVLGLAALLLLLVFAGKLSAAWLTGRAFGHGTAARLTMAGLTLPQAAATLAVASTARDEGLFEEKVVDAVIVLIFVTCLLGPIVTRIAGRRLQRQSASAGNR